MGATTSILDKLVGEEGAKFDVTVSLGRQTQLELFGIVLAAIIVGMLLNVAFSKLFS